MPYIWVIEENIPIDLNFKKMDGGWVKISHLKKGIHHLDSRATDVIEVRIQGSWLNLEEDRKGPYFIGSFVILD